MGKGKKIYNDFDYAMTEMVAQSRFMKWQSIDPFPDIKPALLNSADIADYVFTTSMVWPFYPDQLKSAAYEMQLGDEFLYWDDKGTEIHSIIDNDATTITLKKNSITYVTLKESFLLPDYIALRFNLTINHVHKGLLLGTGPLVNPGFQGKLMVPIHNLTPNAYPLRPGDPLISVEFTKLSPTTEWAVEKEGLLRPAVRGVYVQKHKKDLPFKEYLKKALPHGVTKVESSLSHALDAAYNKISEFEADAKKQITDIKEQAKAELRKSEIYRNVVSAATLVGVGALAWMTLQIFQSNQEFISQAIDKKSEIYASLTVQKDRLNKLESELQKIKISKDYLQNNELRKRVDFIETEIKQISTNIDSAKAEIKSIK